MIYNYSPGSEHMYGFSEFTCSLNEPEPGVCPTDSRLRPDQRIMENVSLTKMSLIVRLLYCVLNSECPLREAPV